MNQSTPTAQRDLENGDRVRIQQGIRAIPNLLGQVGTIVEIFRAPRESCLVQIDGDANKLRTWFVYRDEIAFSGT